MTHNAYTPQVQAYRWYDDDGGEAASTSLANENTSYDVDVSAGNVTLHLRMLLEETGDDSDGDNGAVYQLRYNHEGGGATNVTAGSSVVQAAGAGSQLTDDGATTNRATNGLTDEEGSFEAGLQEEGNGAFTRSSGLSSGNFTEDVWAITIIAADVANNDTITFDYTEDGSPPTFNVTPTLTINKGPAITDVDTDEVVYDGQQDVVITGVGFGATTGEVWLTDNAGGLGIGNDVRLAVDSWADTSIQVDIQEITTGNPVSDDIQLFSDIYAVVVHNDTTEGVPFPIQITTEPEAALNTNATLEVDTTYILLVRVENTGGAGASDFRWALNHDSNGDTPLTTGSSFVQAVATAAFLNDDDIAEILTGSGTFIVDNNAGSEDGTFSLTSPMGAGSAFVAALAFQIVGADVSDEETGTIRLELNDGTDLDTYTNTFTYTVNKAAAFVFPPNSLALMGVGR